MNQLFSLLLLALLWSFLNGGVNTTNLVVGSLIGLVLMAVLSIGSERRTLLQRIIGFLVYVATFLRLLVVANIAVAKLTLRPKLVFHPHIIAVPLRVRSDVAISMLSATVNLLPGTVFMGISDDRRMMYAHAIGDESPEIARNGIFHVESLIMRFTD